MSMQTNPEPPSLTTDAGIQAFWDLVHDLSKSGSDVFVLTEKGRAYIKINSAQWSNDQLLSALVLRVRTLEANLELAKREIIALKNKQSGYGDVSRHDGS